SDDTLALELSRSSNHPARNPDSRSGQNRDNLAKCRVVGGCPPTTNYPMKMGLVVSSGLKSFRKKRLLTGGLLVRVQPEEPFFSNEIVPPPSRCRFRATSKDGTLWGTVGGAIRGDFNKHLPLHDLQPASDRSTNS